MIDYDPFNKPQLSPERLAELEEQRRGTAEEIDRTLRDLSDQEIADLTEDAPHILMKSFTALSYEEKKAWRARNEQTRREHAAKLKAERDAQDASREQARVTAAQAEARKLLWANWQGTAAEFEEKWPQLWARYRDCQALDGATAGRDALLDQKRRELGL
jgi:hypothetical protein